MREGRGAPDGTPRPSSTVRLLDRVGGEIALLEELPVLARGVELVVRDRVLGRVAVGVEADVAEHRIVLVGRVGNVRADLLTQCREISHAGSDGLQGLEEDLRAGV